MKKIFTILLHEPFSYVHVEAFSEREALDILASCPDDKRFSFKLRRFEHMAQVIASSDKEAYSVLKSIYPKQDFPATPVTLPRGLDYIWVREELTL